MKIPILGYSRFIFHRVSTFNFTPVIFIDGVIMVVNQLILQRQTRLFKVDSLQNVYYINNFIILYSKILKV